MLALQVYFCVSRMVRDNVRDKLDFAFEDMGEQQVKNITRPVRVYALRSEGIVPASKVPGGKSSTAKGRFRSRHPPFDLYTGDGSICPFAVTRCNQRRRSMMPLRHSFDA